MGYGSGSHVDALLQEDKHIEAKREIGLYVSLFVTRLSQFEDGDDSSIKNAEA